MKTYTNTSNETVQLIHKTKSGKQWYFIKPGQSKKVPEEVAKLSDALQENAIEDKVEESELEAVVEKELPPKFEKVKEESKKKKARHKTNKHAHEELKLSDEGNTFAQEVKRK